MHGTRVAKDSVGHDPMLTSVLDFRLHQKDKYSTFVSTDGGVFCYLYDGWR